MFCGNWHLKKVGLVLSKERNEKLLKMNNRGRKATLRQMKKSRRFWVQKDDCWQRDRGEAWCGVRAWTEKQVVSSSGSWGGRGSLIASFIRSQLGGGEGWLCSEGGNFWASLVAQWLRIHLPMQGTWVQALVQEDPTCHRASKLMHHRSEERRVGKECRSRWSPYH